MDWTVLPPQAALQWICKDATWDSSSYTLAPALIIWALAWGILAQCSVHPPASALLTKSCPWEPTFQDGLLQDNTATLFLTSLPRETSLLYTKSFSLLHSCKFRPFWSWTDLPCPRSFLGHELLLLNSYNLNFPFTNYIVRFVFPAFLFCCGFKFHYWKRLTYLSEISQNAEWEKHVMQNFRPNSLN